MHKIVLSWWLKKRLKRTAVLVAHPRPPTQLPTKPRTLSQITTISFWVNESYYFLASQDALKVMLVSQSVSQSVTLKTDLADVTVMMAIMMIAIAEVQLQRLLSSSAFPGPHSG